MALQYRAAVLHQSGMPLTVETDVPDVAEHDIASRVSPRTSAIATSIAYSALIAGREPRRDDMQALMTYDNFTPTVLANGTFLNPVFAGDRPDPSVLKDIVTRFGGELALNAAVEKGGVIEVNQNVELIQA